MNIQIGLRLFLVNLKLLGIQFTKHHTNELILDWDNPLFKTGDVIFNWVNAYPYYEEHPKIVFFISKKQIFAGNPWDISTMFFGFFSWVFVQNKLNTVC